MTPRSTPRVDADLAHRLDCLGAEALIARQSPAVQAAIRASVRARLRTRGVALTTAYLAHRAALAGRSHDRRAAAAWREAIRTAADMLLRSA